MGKIRKKSHSPQAPHLNDRYQVVQTRLFGGSTRINLNNRTRVTTPAEGKSDNGSAVPHVEPLTEQEISHLDTVDEPDTKCEDAGWLSMKCKQEGHMIRKRVTCRKEYCPECGKKGGVVHMQRYHRWRNKAQVLLREYGGVGYLVITVPDWCRHLMGRDELGEYQRYVTRKMKREFCDHGLINWHWCGEDGKTWKPHLNVLFGSKYLDPETLEGLKNDLTARLNRLLGVEIDQQVVYYQYGMAPGWVNHKVRYSVRPTWRVYSEYIEERVWGYMNHRQWGNWKEVIQDNAFTKVEKMQCPVCGGELECIGFDGMKELPKRKDWLQLGGGVYVFKWKNKMDEGDGIPISSGK